MRNNMKMKTYGLIVVHFLNTLDILLRPSTSSSSTVQCVWLQVRIRLKINLDCGYSNYSIGHWQGSMWRGILASHSICVTSMDPKRLGLSLGRCSRSEHPDIGQRWQQDYTLPWYQMFSGNGGDDGTAWNEHRRNEGILPAPGEVAEKGEQEERSEGGLGPWRQ